MNSTPPVEVNPRRREMVQQAERISSVIEILRAFPECGEAQWIADAFAAWLSAGGDLQSHLGLKPRQGGAFDQPGTADRLHRRDCALRDLAASLPVRNKAEALAEMARKDHPLIIRISEESYPVPSSKSQLKRIIRSGG